MRISDWSSDVCSSDLVVLAHPHHLARSRMSAATLIDEINGVAEIARMGGLKVSLLIADRARLDPETLRTIIQSATGSWLYDGIGLMDRVGVLSPGGSAALVRSVRGPTDMKADEPWAGKAGVRTC